MQGERQRNQTPCPQAVLINPHHSFHLILSLHPITILGSHHTIKFSLCVLCLPIYKQGFLNLGTIDILGWIILGAGGCPVHHRVFSLVSGLYPLDGSSNPSPNDDNPKCLQISPEVPWGQNPPHPKLRTGALKPLSAQDSQTNSGHREEISIHRDLGRISAPSAGDSKPCPCRAW